MRRLAVSVVLLASCSVVNAQESGGQAQTAPPPNGNWFTRLWSIGDKPEPKNAASTPKKSDPAPVEIAANRLTRENVILNRREQVILKLREIAHATHDDELLRKADDLQLRAWDVYLQKTDSPGAAGATAGGQAMKLIAVVLAVCAMAVAGCLEPHLLGTKEKEPAAGAKTAIVQERPPSVSPDKVNEANAHAMAAALKAEIDFDARQEQAKIEIR